MRRPGWPGFETDAPEGTSSLGFLKKFPRKLIKELTHSG